MFWGKDHHQRKPHRVQKFLKKMKTMIMDHCSFPFLLFIEVVIWLLTLLINCLGLWNLLWMPKLPFSTSVSFCLWLGQQELDMVSQTTKEWLVELNVSKTVLKFLCNLRKRQESMNKFKNLSLCWKKKSRKRILTEALQVINNKEKVKTIECFEYLWILNLKIFFWELNLWEFIYKKKNLYIKDYYFYWSKWILFFKIIFFIFCFKSINKLFISHISGFLLIWIFFYKFWNIKIKTDEQKH